MMTSYQFMGQYFKDVGWFTRYAHGTCCPKSQINLCKASLAPILVGQARKPGFNSVTLIFCV